MNYKILAVIVRWSWAGFLLSFMTLLLDLEFCIVMKYSIMYISIVNRVAVLLSGCKRTGLTTAENDIYIDAAEMGSIHSCRDVRQQHIYACASLHKPMLIIGWLGKPI
jgi:hypothetical protein